jgi:hypothetical protein
MDGSSRYGADEQLRPSWSRRCWKAQDLAVGATCRCRRLALEVLLDEHLVGAPDQDV